MQRVHEDSIAIIAHAAAEKLTSEYGSRLVADVEAALSRPDSARRDPDLYDWVSLGELIVATTALGYTIYADHKKRTPNSPPQVIVRVLRTELRRSSGGSPDSDKIIEVIVAEIAYGQNKIADD